MSPFSSSRASTSGRRSKWSTMDVLPRPVTSSTSVMPAAAASSTMYCRTGRSTTGNSSLGTALVAGRNRVARPAAGMTALTARRPVACAFGVIEVTAPSLRSCPGYDVRLSAACLPRRLWPTRGDGGRRVGEAVGVPATVLGRVQRVVGGLEHVLRVRPVLGEDGHPDRDGDRD